LQPAQGKHGYINGKYGWGIEHGTILDMYLVIEYSRDLASYLSQHAFAHGYHAGACGAHILLHAGIDQREPVKVHLAAQDITAHIGHYRYIRYRYGLPLRTINGIVSGNVQVLGLGRNGKLF